MTNIKVGDKSYPAAELLEILEAANTLGQVCVKDPEFMKGWDRAGTASVVAAALTILTGKQLTVAHHASFMGSFDIVPEETPQTADSEYTFILIELPARTAPRWWRAFAIPQESIYPIRTGTVTTLQLMFTADNETKAREYVREKYPNAKFFGDKP